MNFVWYFLNVCDNLAMYVVMCFRTRSWGCLWTDNEENHAAEWTGPSTDHDKVPGNTHCCGKNITALFRIKE